MMFGYATDESEQYMPLTMFLARELVEEITCQMNLVRQDFTDVMKYLRPDAKTQVTIEYDEATNKPIRVHTIVVSVQHDEFDTDEKMLERIRKDVKELIIDEVFEVCGMNHLLDENTIIHVNPTGKFVIGGPHGDTGLTGRKIIVDTYGGWGAHGGGAFSGKDPSKVDRSAAYMGRYIAKNLVAAGIAKRMLVQLSYAIGVAEPVSVFVNTYGTAVNGLTDAEIAESIKELFDLRPAAIVRFLELKNPIYLETARYGHFGIEPWSEVVGVVRNGVPINKSITYYKWEDLDSVGRIKSYFSQKGV
jgi:S-adenosylmethionine synthetase